METKVLRGGCHCGNLSIEYETTIEPADSSPRACDCSFCSKHGAMYLSDPQGALAIVMKKRGTLVEYRQGSQGARFLLCRDCGVLVAVFFDTATSSYGAVNSRCLEGGLAFGTPQPVSPQQLSSEEKERRWKQVWTPRVTLTVAGT